MGDRTSQGKEIKYLTSEGTEPTTSEEMLLPALPAEQSYEADGSKSWIIMVVIAAM